jgi:hypothetical protein
VPLHQPRLLHQLVVVSQMMTAFIVILVMECQWSSLWRVSGVEVELAWSKIMLRLGHAHLMDHLIMHGIEKHHITNHCVNVKLHSILYQFLCVVKKLMWEEMAVNCCGTFFSHLPKNDKENHESLKVANPHP